MTDSPESRIELRDGREKRSMLNTSRGGAIQ